MKGKRKLWVPILKLVLAAALITYVVYSIQWVDRLETVDDSGATVESIEGRIVGRWDVAEVQFVPDGASEPIAIAADGDGTQGRPQVTAGFLTYLRNLDPWLFALGAFCYLVSLTSSSLRWWWLLRVNSVTISMWDALRYTWIGVFFNNVVPGQTGGDVVKAIYIMKRAGPSARVVSLVSVIVDRVLGLASLALLGAVVVLFHIERFPEVAIGIWGVLLGVMLLGVVAFSRRIRRGIGLDALMRRLPMSGLLQKIDSAIMFYRGHKAGIAVWLVLGALNHCVSVLSVLFIGDALGVGMPAIEYFVLIPVINILSAVPIGPNGWGIGEAAYGYLFKTYGARYLPEMVDPQRIMATRGVALSVLYRVHLTLWSLVGGVFALFERDRVTRDDVEHEIQREDDEAGGEAPRADEVRI